MRKYSKKLIINPKKRSNIKPMKTEVQSEKIKGDFIHMVFFWLKNPENQNDRQAFEKALEKFIATNPQVVNYHLGQPAATNRSVVDNTYSYCLVVTFCCIFILCCKQLNLALLLHKTALS